MKYRWFLAFAIIVVFAFGGFLYAAWPYRGLVPNIVPPPIDLSDAASTGTGTIQTGKNETGLPLNVPEGFSMNVFAKGLGNPRVIQFDPKGVLFVSVPEQGKILAAPDENKDGVADMTKTILQGLERPHGFDFDGQHDGTLFVAEADMLTKYRYLASSNSATDRKELYALPSGGRHWTKTLLYEPSLGFGSPAVRISIGSSCDVCHESDKRRATVLALEVGETRDETTLLEESTGLRNSVFMTRGPDGKVWATEMGRDFLGDDLPPDEINIIEDDKNYGWPICYGKISMTRFSTRIRISEILAWNRSRLRARSIYRRIARRLVWHLFLRVKAGQRNMKAIFWLLTMGLGIDRSQQATKFEDLSWMTRAML